jgi:hypothetical protein
LNFDASHIWSDYGFSPQHTNSRYLWYGIKGKPNIFHTYPNDRNSAENTQSAIKVEELN